MQWTDRIRHVKIILVIAAVVIAVASLVVSNALVHELADEERTMIFYESPYRVVKCLEQFAEVFGPERAVSVSRELTKKFEQTVRGTVAEVLEHFRTHEPKGEFVLVVAGKPRLRRSAAASDTESDVMENPQDEA